MKKALEDVRVLDVSSVLAGPFCSTILADLGAEVLKVEMPGIGDTTRHVAPPVKGVPIYFAAMHRNKKGLTLNLKRPEGQEIFRELVAHVDVVLENFTPGTMDGWGLGYETLRGINPRLIYAAISGFGQTGPLTSLPAFDTIAQAMGGFMSITGFPDGPPTRGGGSMADYVSGVFCAVGILAALHYRDKTGSGQQVDLAMMDVIMAISDVPLVMPRDGKRRVYRMGNRHPMGTPMDCFKAKDGYVVIGVVTDRHWPRLARAIGRADLAEDPEFTLARNRRKHSAEANQLVADWVAGKTVADVLDELSPERADVPCSPVLEGYDLVEHPQVKARGMITAVEHPSAGRILVKGTGIRLSEAPASVEHLGPAELGQDNLEVYSKLLDYDGDKIARLTEEGIL